MQEVLTTLLSGIDAYQSAVNVDKTTDIDIRNTVRNGLEEIWKLLSSKKRTVREIFLGVFEETSNREDFEGFIREIEKAVKQEKPGLFSSSILQAFGFQDPDGFYLQGKLSGPLQNAIFSTNQKVNTILGEEKEDNDYLFDGLIESYKPMYDDIYRRFHTVFEIINEEILGPISREGRYGNLEKYRQIAEYYDKRLKLVGDIGDLEKRKNDLQILGSGKNTPHITRQRKSVEGRIRRTKARLQGLKNTDPENTTEHMFSIAHILSDIAKSISPDATLPGTKKLKPTEEGIIVSGESIRKKIRRGVSIALNSLFGDLRDLRTHAILAKKQFKTFEGLTQEFKRQFIEAKSSGTQSQVLREMKEVMDIWYSEGASLLEELSIKEVRRRRDAIVASLNNQASSITN